MELVAQYSNFTRPETQLVERALAAGERLRACGVQPTKVVAPPPAIHRAKDRLSALELELVAGRYQAGESAAVLGSEFELAKQTVMRLLKDAGVPLHRPRMTEAERSEAIRLYGDGWSLARIGSKLGRDQSSIRNVLLRAGIERRDEHGRNR